VTRIGAKRGEASHVRRSDRLLKPQLRCALHFVHCGARLHSFCFLASCRFANCANYSLVAVFALMVYGYRIIVLRCRWLITSVIRGKTSLFHDCVLAPRALLKFFSSSLLAYCETTAGFTTVGHATNFCVSPGNGRRLDITSAEPITDTISKITAQTVGDCSV